MATYIYPQSSEIGPAQPDTSLLVGVIVGTGVLAGGGALVGYLVGHTKVAALVGALVGVTAPPILIAARRGWFS